MNIIDKIKVGDIIYSTIAGKITITEIDPKGNFRNIVVKSEQGLTYSFCREGKYCAEGECVLFPSKENRDWSTYNSNKFNINTLEPFDKVLVRDENYRCWTTGFYSHYEDNGDMRFFISSSVSWIQCIPYNDDTKHLVGTTDMPDSKYINW